jgi:hypothetical protein
MTLIMFISYFVLLCYNLTLIALLFNTNDGNIWMSNGGISIIASNLVGFLLVISCMEGFGIPASSELQSYSAWIHVIALGVCGLTLTIGALITASNMLSMQDKAFCRSHESEVNAWYRDAFPSDLPPPGGRCSDHDLRKWFADVLQVHEADLCVSSERHLASAKKAAVAFTRRSYLLFSQAMQGYRKPSNTTNDVWKRHNSKSIQFKSIGDIH